MFITMKRANLNERERSRSINCSDSIQAHHLKPRIQLSDAKAQLIQRPSQKFFLSFSVYVLPLIDSFSNAIRSLDTPAADNSLADEPCARGCDPAEYC